MLRIHLVTGHVTALDLKVDNGIGSDAIVRRVVAIDRFSGWVGTVADFVLKLMMSNTFQELTLTNLENNNILTGIIGTQLSGGATRV